MRCFLENVLHVGFSDVFSLDGVVVWEADDHRGEVPAHRVQSGCWLAPRPPG